jgi:rhodanese-related sulfurtransferase
MRATISATNLAALMASDSLYAVFDVRERGEFNECQIADTTSLPRSQIEFRVAQLVPNRKVLIVVYDEGGERARPAAKTLVDLGYEQISILEGGLTEWRRQGRATVSGVNVPSKAFGEKVHQERSIPEMDPEELNRLQQEGAELTILDVRTPEEYARFCIPDGLNVPGGDLVLWAEELKQKTNSIIVINCAGRTRSIIGTAALCRLGLSNVRALKNGTMGWVLAGLELENKPGRKTPSAPRVSQDRATELALRIAEEERIPWISPRELSALIGNAGSSVNYLIDVRSEKEYDSSHVAGSINVPGGQAVQRADDFVAVRNARIIFISNESARAVMAAYWYRQMGFPNVYVLQGGLRRWAEDGEKFIPGSSRDEPMGLESVRPTVRFIDLAELNRKIQESSVLVLDVGTSVEFEIAHVQGAKWISRGWLEIKFPEQFPDRYQPIIVTCADGRQSTLAARVLTDIGYADVSILEGGVRAGVAAGLPMEKGLDACLVPPNDVVLSPSIRGTKEDMQQYLEWELKLVR